MGFSTDFKTCAADAIHQDAAARKQDGWRYVQILAVNNENSVDLVYSYMKDGLLDNVVVEDLPRQERLSSITDVYLEAFVCENEIHDLFGIAFDGLAIDFEGNFYRVSTEVPMTIISPEKLAEQEKQRKLAEKKAKAEAAKAEKAAAEHTSGEPADQGGEDELAIDAEMEAKLAAMNPEKAAKVRAAMEAKAKKAQLRAQERGE